jgi:hypothetical protein|tara:strand:+ start:147 stop:365 length:219 start_codon:yes stop_codon:yes gene_type:complete
MTYSLITDCEFNGQLTIKSTDSKNKTIDINFEFGTQGLNGQIISFSGTKGKIYIEAILKSMCEAGLETIKRQ